MKNQISGVLGRNKVIIRNTHHSSSRCSPHGTLRAAKMRDIVVGGHSASLYPGCFARAASTGMTSEAGGFTLIELLVVVLIIGILAAVAVPQYTQAVEKSRFATYRAIANSMAQAADVFYLANGTWPTSLDELDMEFPADMSTESSLTYGICRKNNKMYCCMMIPTVDWNGGSVHCGDNDYHLSYRKIYARDNGTPATNMSCSAKEEKYKAICKAISGGKNGTTTSTFTPDGWRSGYYSYEID